MSEPAPAAVQTPRAGPARARGSAASEAARVRSPHGAAVAGLGTALPDTVVANDVIAERIGVTDDWIVQRTGIHERRVLAPTETLADLAAQAARAALADAAVDAADLDLVLVATATPDDLVPNLAPAVSGRLGAGCGALDVGGACAGFIAAIGLGAAQLESGRADAVLVIGAERLSQFVDRDDKRTAALFGDAAGAVVLTRTAAPGELGPVILRSDDKRDLLFTSRERALIEMQGYEVFQHAVARMVEVTHEALAAAGCGLEDVDVFAYHQANARIVRSVGQRLGLDTAKVLDSIGAVGNVSAASIPLALQRARDDGRLPDGSRVLLAAFGAGFVWGAAVLDWRATA